jgi:hypothetical protein
MEFILPDSILEKEIHPLQEIFSTATLVKSAKKVVKGLGIQIPGAPKGMRFVKMKLTSVHGSGRVLFLVQVENSYLLPLLLRDKKDKVGINMSPRNSAFLKEVEKNLDHALNDIEKGKFEILQL